jgi:hypothetical protein
MAFSIWLIHNGFFRVASSKWLLQNASSKWLLQIGFFKMAFSK